MLLQAADKGSANQVLEALNNDNAEQNLNRKRTKRLDKPSDAAVVDAKRPLTADGKKDVVVTTTAA